MAWIEGESMASASGAGAAAVKVRRQNRMAAKASTRGIAVSVSNMFGAARSGAQRPAGGMALALIASRWRNNRK